MKCKMQNIHKKTIVWDNVLAPTFKWNESMYSFKPSRLYFLFFAHGDLQLKVWQWARELSAICVLFIRAQSTTLPSFYYLGFGKSQLFCTHSVICLRSSLIISRILQAYQHATKSELGILKLYTLVFKMASML